MIRIRYTAYKFSPKNIFKNRKELLNIYLRMINYDSKDWFKEMDLESALELKEFYNTYNGIEKLFRVTASIVLFGVITVIVVVNLKNSDVNNILFHSIFGAIFFLICIISFFIFFFFFLLGGYFFERRSYKDYISDKSAFYKELKKLADTCNSFDEFEEKINDIIKKK